METNQTSHQPTNKSLYKEDPRASAGRFWSYLGFIVVLIAACWIYYLKQS